jgi:hypothetical protein
MGMQRVGRRETTALFLIIALAVALVALNAPPRQSIAQSSQMQVANNSVEIKFSVKGRKSCPGSFCTKGGTFNLFNVSFISISSDDEMRAFFFSPIDNDVRFRIGENREPQQAISFPIAMPLFGWEVGCENEVQSCNGTISIVGTVPSAG